MDDVIKALVALIQAQFPTYKVVDGNVTVYNESICPLICVYDIGSSFSNKTNLTLGGGGNGWRLSEVGIKVVLNIKDYLGGLRDASNTRKHSVKIREIFEKKGSDGIPDTDTIIGIILRNQIVQGKYDAILDETIEVRYDENEYNGSYFVFGTTTFTTKQYLPQCNP